MFEQGQTFEEFLKDYYSLGPNKYLSGAWRKQVASLAGVDEISKILTATETNWYENKFQMNCQLALSAFSEIYKLLDKKPITAVGDSFKFITDLGVETSAIGPGGAEAIFGAETEPTVTPITGITSGVERVILSRELHSMVKEMALPLAGAEPNWDFLKNTVAPKALWNTIDTWLGGYETAAAVHGVDTPAAKHIECLDRMISSKAESGGAVHVSAAEDGDIVWDGLGSGTPKFDRSAVTTADANVKLPGVAGTAEAYHILEELDDIFNDIKRYSLNKRYILLTTGKTANKIDNEVGGRQRFNDVSVNVALNLGGIDSKPGVTGGFDVGAVQMGGYKVPVFTSEALPTKNSVYGTATSGHAYLIDLDSLYVRVDIPVTFLETGFGAEMLNQNYLRSRAMLFTMQQLVCENFKANGALKWIKA